ncbi:hypothetical protein ACGFX4_16140 [Kitasatospora sp. NPDC048365]|uniref:hypothetical protein n=1 Tax=Kitasatospora sp. NPDC048365 TaxID=3364050 RepID=UPI00371114A2
MSRQHREPGPDPLEDFLADYEACLAACADEARLRTVWALPYLESGPAVPPIPDVLLKPDR